MREGRKAVRSPFVETEDEARATAEREEVTSTHVCIRVCHRARIREAGRVLAPCVRAPARALIPTLIPTLAPALILALALTLILLPALSVPALATASDASATVVERLREVAGTTESVTFWSGGTAERPTYTWTFEGYELAREQLSSLDALDLGIVPSAEDADGSGTVDTLMLDFSHEGVLPAPAHISLAVPEELEGFGDFGDFGGGSRLSLFAYDERQGSFTGILHDLPVEDGYVSFILTHCSVWALSTIDLSALTAGAASESVGMTTSTAESAVATASASMLVEGTALGLPAFRSAAPALLLSVLVIGVAGLVAVLVRGRMRRRELAAMQQGWGVSSVVFEDIPSIDELSEIEEPGC